LAAVDLIRYLKLYNLRKAGIYGILIRVPQCSVEDSREPRPERITPEGWETRENGKEDL
jgi:hypothetical protein